MSNNEPKFVKDWREAMPRCCWTCVWHRESDSYCIAHDAEVPNEFKEQLNQCNQHGSDLPF